MAISVAPAVDEVSKGARCGQHASVQPRSVQAQAQPTPALLSLGEVRERLRSYSHRRTQLVGSNVAPCSKIWEPTARAKMNQS